MEYSIFKIDIYRINYYKTEKDSEKLTLKYKVDVKKEYSQEGWQKSLKYYLSKGNAYKEKLKWITKNCVDLKKGDLFIIEKKEGTVFLRKNNKLIAKIKDPIIAEMILSPWIGPKPIDKKIKKELLNL